MFNHTFPNQGDMAMRKLFIFICLIFFSFPLFSQTNIYQIKHNRAKAHESMLQHLPGSLREKYQFPIPIIDDPRGLEGVTVDERVPFEFFTNLTVEDSGLMVTYTYHEWDTLAQDWSIDPYQRLQISYDSTGNMTEYLGQNWDGTDLVNDWRNLYTYDSNGNRTEFLWQDWDGADWVNSWRELDTYDSKGFLTEVLGQEWDGVDWVNEWWGLSTYDSMDF